jgi:multidrug efflux pump subunit AcrA (membrane-fusion protein)
MCLQALGRSKRWPWGTLALALFLTISGSGAGYAEEAQKPQAAPPPAAPETDIIFSGKVFCSLKRRIDLPFKGVITALKVHSGQKVKAGEVLATYRLAPESMLAIRQRLSPPQLSETEVKLAETERNLVPLMNKQRELTHLEAKKLATSQSLKETKQQVQLLKRQQTALQDRLQKDQQLARQDQQVLSSLLGSAVNPGKIPRVVALRAPISGYVIWVNPEMRKGAELPPLPAAFQIGVMDPMVVRGQAFEIEALQIKVGDEAEVTLDSLPGRQFQGTVSRVSWSSTTTSMDQPSYYEVEIKVPNPDLALKEGLKARIVLHKSR